MVVAIPLIGRDSIRPPCRIRKASGDALSTSNPASGSLPAGMPSRPGTCSIDILPAMNDRDSYRATHEAPWWVLASQAAARTSPGLTPPPRAFKVSASPAATMRPSTRMFLAAFRSRSWVMPHCGQVQDLTVRGFLPELNPHPEHSWLDGNQRLTLTTVRWQRSAFSFQQPHQHRPAGVGHRLAQPGPGQTGHGQVLHVDRLVIANYAVGQFVMCVQAGIADLAMLDSNPAYRLGAPLRPLRLPRQGPLRAGQRPRPTTQEARILHDLTTRQHGETDQAKIDPNIAG